MWLEYLRIALSVLRGHKFRSLLTVMSITIGAFSIVIMTSLADSGLKTLAAGIEEIGGARLVSVWRKNPEAMESKQISYTRGITRQDGEVLRTLPHLEDITVFNSLRGKGLIADSGKRVNGDVVAADARFLEFFRYKIAQGRGLDAEDMQAHARVCVIGDTLADKLWGKGEQVLGRQVTLYNMHCLIVGRLTKLDRWGVGFGWEWDEVLAAPFETLQDHNKKEVETGIRVIMRTASPQRNDIVKRMMNSILLDRHHGVDDFSIFDLAKRLDGFTQIFVIMQAIVGLLAGIALLVGGVGIMNIMLVSVSERVREIGIRKAIGAAPQDISRQFLVEAILLSAAGGIVGVALGIGGAIAGSMVIKHFKPSWVISVSEPAVVISLVVTFAIGLGFGYFPARRAGRLDPVVAIRSGA
jgi:putative ABC transport system permease protein